MYSYVFVEYNKVGILAGSDRTLCAVNLYSLCGVKGSSVNNLVQGKVGVILYVLNGVIHTENTACNGAVLKETLNTLKVELLTAKVILAIGHTAGSGAVGDKTKLVPLSLGNEGEERLVDMEGVADKLNANVAGKCRAYNAGVTVLKSSLSVKEVGDPWREECRYLF